MSLTIVHENPKLTTKAARGNPILIKGMQALREAAEQRRTWQRRENLLIIELKSEGLSYKKISGLVGVTPQAITNRLVRLEKMEGYKSGQFESEAKALRTELEGEEGASPYSDS